MGWVWTVDWVKTTQVILQVTQALALAIGGLWVYFNFMSSRTFARRATIDLKASVLKVEQQTVLRVHVVLRNTGLSKIPLRPHRQVVTLWATSATDFHPGANFAWHRLIVSEAFKTDESVESKEAIEDVVLLPVGQEGEPWMAFRIQMQAWSQPRWKWFGRVRWVTQTIIPADGSNPVPSEAGGGNA